MGLVFHFHCPAETTGRVLERRTSAKPESTSAKNAKAFKHPQTENEGIRRTLLKTDRQELASSFSLTEKSGASKDATLTSAAQPVS